MRRTWHIWLAFAACLAVVLGAMGWISATMLRMERTEAHASRQAAVQEKIRLALWRMDSALTPLIARESARPYFTYTAFHPVDRAYTRMFAEIQPDEILVPSPLLTYRTPPVLLHFQFGPTGELTSPQVPTGNQRDLAETGYATHEQIESAAERLTRLKAILNREDLLARLPQPDASAPVPMLTQQLDARRQDAARDPLRSQQAFNTAEQQMRAASVQNAAGFRSPGASSVPSHAAVREGAMEAVWAGDSPVLARRVSIETRDYVQGCWLDWARVREWLLAEVGDLLPQADLAPAKGDAGNGETYMLAALPVRVLPGAVPHDTPTGAWPVRLSLLIAWGCLLLGAASVALVLWGAIALSERRGAFVSAVTHELRTPLTTFRLYADLLAQGLITDEKKKEGYLNRLREESERLSHLVENVLAYARLSGPRSGGKVERVALAELVERSRERLAARAEQAGMQLVIEPPGGGVEARVAANTSAVEQILMNLVDNACKYAGRAADRRIHLQADRGGDRGLIRVRDHGPGISREEAKRLFRPFRKSAHEAASSAPGVGLGLALSRRLARDMGGDLRLEEDVKDGARFVLSLPV